jgi:hypothetical protein
MKIKDKKEEREEIERAMESFKKPVRVVTKEDELMELSNNDYTDYTMRCGELGFIPGHQKN